MASAVAASVFGLLKSKHMNWTNDMIMTMVLETADPVIYSVNSENYLKGMIRLWWILRSSGGHWKVR